MRHPRAGGSRAAATLSSERSLIALGAHQRPRRAGVEAEPPAEPDALLEGIALRLGLVAHPAQVGRLVGENRDCEGGVVTGTDPCSNAIRYSERQIVGCRNASRREMNATPAASEPTPVNV